MWVFLFIQDLSHFFLFNTRLNIHTQIPILKQLEVHINKCNTKFKGRFDFNKSEFISF